MLTVWDLDKLVGTEMCAWIKAEVIRLADQREASWDDKTNSYGMEFPDTIAGKLLRTAWNDTMAWAG